MKSITMRSGNKGLTVKVNLFALEKYLADHNSKSARLWMRGSVTHADTGEERKFNDGGQLLSTIGEWNKLKYQGLKKKAARPRNGRRN